MHFPFISEDWGTDEEILFYEGLEKYGLGNWTEISEYVSTKSKFQCQKHFEEHFKHVPNWPTPDLKILTSRRNIKSLNSEYTAPPSVSHSKTVVNNQDKEKDKEKDKQKVENQAARPELCGYMPERDEFETEWENNNEVKVEDVVLEPTDTPRERELKIKIMEIYNFKLDLRRKRKKFVIDRKFHDIRYQDKLTKTQSKQERDYYYKYKHYLQVLSEDEFEIFLKNISQEENLKEKINKLQKWRRLGLKSVKESDQYKKSKAKRKNEKTKRKDKKFRQRSKTEVNIIPGMELLSNNELKICSSLNLLPHHYLLIKESILREYVTTGKVDLERAKTIIKLDGESVKQIVEFFEHCGWINNNHLSLTPKIFYETTRSIGTGGTNNSPGPLSPLGSPSPNIMSPSSVTNGNVNGSLNKPKKTNGNITNISMTKSKKGNIKTSGRKT